MRGDHVDGRGDTPNPAREDGPPFSAEPAPKSTMTPAIGEFHPAALIFPLMEESALDELATDIAVNGLREPIWRHRDGRIIDGRNRWLACQRAGLECRHRTYERGDDTIVAFAVSRNLHRRHLTIAQRAAVAAELASLARGDNQHTLKVPSNEGTSQAQAAQLMGVSVASVERAAAVKRAAPELHEKVKAGEMSTGVARIQIARDAEVRRSVAEPEPSADPTENANCSHSDVAAPNHRDQALSAITAVAKVKISGTAAARDYEWSDAELLMADKAFKWVKMFTNVVRRERHRRVYDR